MVTDLVYRLEAPFENDVQYERPLRGTPLGNKCQLVSDAVLEDRPTSDDVQIDVDGLVEVV